MEDHIEGIHHRHKDYYSESSPIPSIQRFFKKGLAEVIAKRNALDSDSDSDAEEVAVKELENVEDSPLQLTESATPRANVSAKAEEEERKGVGEAPTAQPPPKTGKSKKKRLSDIFSSSSRRKSRDSDSDNQHDDETKSEAHNSAEADSLAAHQSPDQADKAYKRSRKPRQAYDPVTGRKTEIHDVGKNEYRHTLARTDAGDKLGREQVLRSQMRGNLTSKPFPPAETLPDSVLGIDRRVKPFFGVWAVLTVMGWVPRVVSVLLNAWLVWWTWRTVLARAEDQRWHRERQRGQKARTFEEQQEEHDAKDGEEGSLGIAEGAEWLNGILESLWSVMNPDLFSSLGGTLEDVMQASIPGFIHSVKVEDLNQGSTPIRITGLRILPDNRVDDLKAGMRKEISEMRRKEKHVTLPVDEHGSQEQIEREQKAQEEQEEGEHYVNIELGFVYRARPTMNGVGGKSRNAHLLIKFWVGARKLLMIPLPVWVEIKGFVGRVRARVQLTSDPPFIKNVTITFCGLPRVGIEVVPLHINTSQIPFLSSFIESSIDAAVGEFVMPSSLTLDVGDMLMGDNIKREVNALGVVVVYIHSASDLEKQDLRGSSDPYCTLSLAKVGKILYSTRVVINELSPRWEERHMILVTREHLDSQDKVSIALWDSDRFSQDDMLGRADVELTDLAKHPNKLFRRSDTLKGLDRERTKQGTITWSLGFFGKAASIRKKQDEKSEEQAQANLEAQEEQNNQGEEDRDDISKLSDRKTQDCANGIVHDGNELDKADSIEADSPLSQEAIDKEKKTQTRNQVTDVDFEPPNPSLPSGVLSMQIHQIANLEVSDHNRTMRPRKKDEPGQDVEGVETEEDPDHAPSAYCRIILNDEIIFQTRTKALNSNPFFNAGTERFVRDWRRTLIMVVVYDYRIREADAILGVVPIKLSDLFKENSQITQFFPLAGGVGHGRIRLSLLFRPIQHETKEKTRLGWNIGTVRLLTSPVATDFDESKGASGHDVHLVSLRASTLAGRAKLAASRARYVNRDSKDAVEWKLTDAELPFKVPARRRYSAPYVIEFRAISALGKRKTTHMCIVWLQDVPDDDIIDVHLPIWRPAHGADFHRLRQNYHHYLHEEEAEKLGVEKVGYLKVKMQFKSGLGKVHTKFDNNPGARVVMDAWRCCIALGLRSVSGDFASYRENKEGYLEEVGEDEGGLNEGDEDDSDTEGEMDQNETAYHPSQKKDNLDNRDDDNHDQEEEDEDNDNDNKVVRRSRSIKQKFRD